MSKKSPTKKPHQYRIAEAKVVGGPFGPEVRGQVTFIDVPGGTQITANITGLPPYQPVHESEAPWDPAGPIGPFGFHIHEYGICEEGDPFLPFMMAGEHWNPTNQPHGNHAGDLPVLFSNNGLAVITVFTDKFKVSDIVGKSVIIQISPDDYKTQPNGPGSARLACGEIKAIK